MTVQSNSPARSIVAWTGIVIAVVALVIATAALTVSLVRGAAWAGGMMGGGGGTGMMGGGGGTGMMGGGGMMGGRSAPDASGPGTPGFIAGTPAAPRVIRLWAGPGYTFSPASISVARGETVTFEITVMGPTAHEFMVGPADAVAADQEGTPEIEGIAMMQTRSITYTFAGSGPFAFACHAPGHYEAGMRGTIVVVG